MLHTDELSTISFTKHMPKLKKLYVFNTNYEIKELYNTHTSQLSIYSQLLLSMVAEES